MIIKAFFRNLIVNNPVLQNLQNPYSQQRNRKVEVNKEVNACFNSVFISQQFNVIM